MRLFEAPSTLLSFVALLLTNSSPAAAGPFSRFNDIVRQEVEKLSHDDLSLQNSTLERRGGSGSGCASGSFACGYYGQVCCVTGSQTCATNAQDQAYCADVAGGSTVATTASGNGQWQTYTSIWTTTGAITMTSIYSSYIAATVTGTASGNCVPNYANDESACGPICCSSGQYCYDSSSGICKPAGNGGYTTTGVTNSPPTRATTSNGVVITVTMSPTTTVPYQTPITTGAQNGNGTLVESHSSGGLSGGAIAGIVIGVIAGIILLILICLCCCLKAGIDGILALLGIGKKKNRRRRVVEEEYIDVHRRHSSAAGSNRRWYGSAAGGRPGRPPPPPPPKERKSGIGSLGALGLGLGGLAVALGLKRRHDRRQEEKSDISSNYYDSYYYSSSSGSGSRTRRSPRR